MPCHLFFVRVDECVLGTRDQVYCAGTFPDTPAVVLMGIVAPPDG